jgi:hypothetical protein
VGGRGAGGWVSVGKEADGRRLWGEGAQAGGVVLGGRGRGCHGFNCGMGGGAHTVREG